MRGRGREEDEDLVVGFILKRKMLQIKMKKIRVIW